MYLDVNLSLICPIFIFRVVKPKPLARCPDKRCISVLSLSLGILSLKSDAFLQSVCSSETPQQHKATQVLGFLEELSKIKCHEKTPGMQGQIIWKDVAKKRSSYKVGENEKALLAGLALSRRKSWVCMTIIFSKRDLTKRPSNREQFLWGRLGS